MIRTQLARVALMSFVCSALGGAVLVEGGSARAADAGPPAAPAAAPVTKATANLMVLHATQVAGAGSIDARVASMPQLKKPPFSAYNTYVLLDNKDLALNKGKGSTYVLQNGRLLEITLLDGDGKSFRVETHIVNASNGTDFLKSVVSAAPNEPFFVAGQGYNGGILVLGFKISG